ncbi:outer membrane beta-barrel protein [Microbulbifer sp. JMSA003]|uniref:outer membrane beta-barrel protein n=1 Tax=Microbulbifer sp. JMSA003 TaxID=3243369 RepID=UPI0040390392
MNNFKTTVKTSLFSSLIFTFATNTSADFANRKYIGATLGETSYPQFCSSANPRIKSQIPQGSTDGRFHCNSSGSTIKFYGGLRWNRYLALEISYLKPSAAQSSFYTNNENGEYAKAAYQVETHLLTAFLLGFYPVNSNINMFARVGTGAWRGKLSEQQSAQFYIPQQLSNGQFTAQLQTFDKDKSQNHKGPHWGVGVGMNYVYRNHWIWRLEWEKLDPTGVDFNAETLSLGLGRLF